ncbi:MAG: Hypothetical protein BHV28_02640 [Candidatus Tokpelaia hoelldobleri]|uniref:DUF4164 family protein n=1 Tax=Candidatus Tokpelaia hoelldobleri TaxID=1902579 RepID=A0A1U9JSZ8_9HYPH|nr:MAG: Hypothetical protein BHV28_02640 [Candidatus Tokpelaia hoelldoblerii]
MAKEYSLNTALERMNKALNVLEAAVETRLESQGQFSEIEEEVQRMNADRSRLARELDKSEAQAEKLEQANKQVSNRLITAMETIRTVIER